MAGESRGKSSALRLPRARCPCTVFLYVSGPEGVRQTCCHAGTCKDAESLQCTRLRNWLADGQERTHSMAASRQPSCLSLPMPWSSSWVPSALSLLGRGCSEQPWHSGSIVHNTCGIATASMQGNVILARSRECSLTPTLPRESGPLTHRSPVAAPHPPGWAAVEG